MKGKFKKNQQLRNLYFLWQGSRQFFKFNLLLFFKQYLWFFKELKKFKEQGENKNFVEIEYFPCLSDKTSTTSFDKHYIYHTAWAARKLSEMNKNEHIDIGSSLYFNVLVSAFVPVRFYDYRPAELKLSNLSSFHVDITCLPFEDNSIASLSCMHVVEHIGLGRYGDSLDLNGDLKAIQELKRVVMCGGDLLFVIPIGQPKIMFNAHRIYSYDQIIYYFNGFELKEFSLIPDQSVDGIIKNASKEQSDFQNYGCGCFWFKKNK